MRVTISTHNGSNVAREHNRRNPAIVSKESHIDSRGVYEVWRDEPVKKAYERLFGQAQADYNARQKRADRRIDSYYNAICKDKQKKPVYELIVGVYGGIDKATGKDILRAFTNDWQRRNPNLELIGAYYHDDEEGEPHIHLDYVPVAHGYKKGMETQTGLVKALGEQGYHMKDKVTAQIQWEKAENAYLEELCVSHGFTVAHPAKEKSVEHLHTKRYKAEMELQATEQALKRAETKKSFAEFELEDVQTEVELAKTEKDDLNAEIFDLRQKMQSATKSLNKTIKSLKSKNTELEGISEMVAQGNIIINELNELADQMKLDSDTLTEVSSDDFLQEFYPDIYEEFCCWEHDKKEQESQLADQRHDELCSLAAEINQYTAAVQSLPSADDEPEYDEVEWDDDELDL